MIFWNGSYYEGMFKKNQFSGFGTQVIMKKSTKYEYNRSPESNMNERMISKVSGNWLMGSRYKKNLLG